MSNKVVCKILFLCILSTESYAEVIDLSAGPYGGQFLDQATGKTWLDVTNFAGTSYNQIVTELAGTPFRLATHAEVQTLFASLPYVPSDGIIGTPSSTGGRYGFISGIYDDSSSGTNPSLLGDAGFQWTLQPPLEYGQHITDDSSEISASANNGAWVIQRAPTLSASNDPASNDMNADGIDEKIVWRNSTGTWYIRFSGSNELLVEQWGLPGDYPILGDYDGDRIPDLVVWRPSNGTWYVKTSSSLFDVNQAVVQQFGLPGDVPMRGDYDGDGILDYAVWRSSEGNWYVLKSSTHEATVEQWGLPGDIPLTSGRSILQ